MELRLNLLFVAALAVMFFSLTAVDPRGSLKCEGVFGQRIDRARMAEMEDALAHAGNDDAPATRGLLIALADSYIEADRPGMAVAVLTGASPEQRTDPLILHQLARAYEGSARVLDALATSQVAVRRCARSLGTADSATTTPIPTFVCDAGTYAMLERHEGALERMAAWGVADPRTDQRAALAYDLAARRARIASAQ